MQKMKEGRLVPDLSLFLKKGLILGKSKWFDSPQLGIQYKQTV